MKLTRKRIIAIIILLILVPVLTQVEKDKNDLNGVLRCDLCLRGYKSSAINLSCGYNYELAKLYCESERVDPEINISEDISSSLAALLEDSLDVAIIPYTDSIVDSKVFHSSRIMADSTLWVTSKQRKGFSTSLFNWLHSYEGTKDNKKLLERFAPSYEPFKRAESGKRYTVLSPYDDLIKQYSAQLGWDSKMLTALIWQESRFRIDAKSRRGPEGLLQMKPSTAKRFKNDDMVDPEKNINAGVSYLNKLKTMFSQFCTEEDLPKFILGAYNAGEGKMLDCIRYAKGHDMPYSTWPDIEKVISEIRDSEEAQKDTLLHVGGIKSFETVNYVSNIYTLYDAFCIISSGQSSQDQPAKHTETE